MALKDLPIDIRNGLQQKETTENRIIRAQLHLSNEWKVLGKTIVTDHPEFDDDNPGIPLLPMTREKIMTVNGKQVKAVVESRYAGETTIHIVHERQDMYRCPHCKAACKPMCYELRRYRHVDDLNHKCFLEVHVPKLICYNCGRTPQLRFPASDPESRHTREFDREILRKMKTETKSSLARDLEISTDVIKMAMDRIIRKAVINQDLSDTTQIFVDETQYGSGHDYISVFANQRHKVIFVCRGHGKDALERFRDYLIIQGGDPESIRVFSADMSRAYEAGVLEYFPNATLVWDRFHLIKTINDALNNLRKRVVRRKDGEPLALIKYTLMHRYENMDRKHIERMREICICSPELALAFDMKEAFCEIVRIRDMSAMERALRTWIMWVTEFGCSEFKKKAKTFLEKIDRIISWAQFRVSNSVCEGINKNIQDMRRQACGFKNDQNFYNTILLRQGELQLLF